MLAHRALATATVARGCALSVVQTHPEYAGSHVLRLERSVAMAVNVFSLQMALGQWSQCVPMPPRVQ